MSKRTDHMERLSVLARSFPSLAGAPGVDPFDADALAGWAMDYRPDASHAAAAFVCAVWMFHDPDLRPSAMDHPGAFLAAEFDALSAAGKWTPGDAEAFARWAAEPWPIEGIRRATERARDAAARDRSAAAKVVAEALGSDRFPWDPPPARPAHLRVVE